MPNPPPRLKLLLPRPVSGLKWKYCGPPPVAGQMVPVIEQTGYERGYGDAEALYQKQILEQRGEMAELQNGLLQSIDARHEELIAEINRNLPDIILAVVAKIWGGLELSADNLAGIVEDVLAELSPGGEKLDLYMHPADARLLRAYEKNPEKTFPLLTIHEDENLQSGDVTLRSRFGHVDARIENKFRKIASELLGGG
jgi:flagellar biosynthesis/type III secretory pathway protein FliH